MPTLEPDWNRTRPTPRIESAHDAGDRGARQTALGIPTSCSGFFLGTSQAGLPIVGQFVQIEQDFSAVLRLHPLLECLDLINFGLVERIRTVDIVASALVVDAQALQALAHAARGFQVEPFTLLNQVF
jgi:hypothetical protein